jgi:hypothetical protein
MKLLQNIKSQYLVIGMLFSLSLSSCSDFLDKDPHDSISDGNFWNSESDAKLALVGCYKFQTGWSHDSFDTPQGLMYLDLAGGNGTEKENFTTNMASVNTTATNSNLRWYWANAYTQIAKYNTFLDNIVNCPMNETTKAAMIAEVKTLRAYFLFNLAFYYKDAPMPLTSLSVDEANSISQTPQAGIYQQVESDLLESIKVLPDTYTGDDYGRISRNAARVLLSRQYMAQERWADAASVLSDVINTGIFELDRRNGDESYEKLFQIGGEYSPEMIFCIMGIKDQYTNSRYIYLFPECCGGWHQFAIYNELVKAYFCTDGKSIDESPLYDDDDPYVNRDQRLYASIFLPPLGTYPGTEFQGKIYDCYKGAGTSDYYNRYTLFNGYCPKKGADPSVTDLYSTYTYTPIMRYGEVLLSYLESLNESSPASVTQDILDKTINDIRDRVNLPAYTKTELNSQEAVRNAVRAERRVELAFEGFRYYDVLRWGTAEKELNHYFTGVKLSNDPNARNYKGTSSVDEDGYYQFENRSWDSHNRYFPIPQNDRNINPNLNQNPGYN